MKRELRHRTMSVRLTNGDTDEAVMQAPQEDRPLGWSR